MGNNLEWIWVFFKPCVLSAREFVRAIKGRMMIRGDRKGFAHLAESNLDFGFLANLPEL